MPPSLLQHVSELYRQARSKIPASPTKPAMSQPAISISARHRFRAINWDFARNFPIRGFSPVARPRPKNKPRPRRSWSMTNDSWSTVQSRWRGPNSVFRNERSTSRFATSPCFASCLQRPSRGTGSAVASNWTCSEHKWNSPHFCRSNCVEMRRSNEPRPSWSSFSICLQRPTFPERASSAYQRIAPCSMRSSARSKSETQDLPRHGRTSRRPGHASRRPRSRVCRISTSASDTACGRAFPETQSTATTSSQRA